MATQTKALATVEEFQLPAVQESAWSAEDIADDFDGIKMRFPRVKVPSGGGISWEIPNPLDPENPDTSKTIDGALLFQHSSNAYWQSKDSTNQAPDCAAIDGKMGFGIPGGPCADCPLNEFESGEGGKGKACKNTKRLYLLRSGDQLPLEIILPPTSIRALSDFITSVFVSRGRGISGSLVQLALKKQENAEGKPYSTVTFKLLQDFNGEQLHEMISYARGFRENVKASWQKATEDDIKAAATDQ